MTWQLQRVSVEGHGDHFLGGAVECFGLAWRESAGLEVGGSDML